MRRPRTAPLAFAVTLTMLGAPAFAQDVPQGQIDALALMAMAPSLCNIDTEARWKATMASVAEQYGVPVNVLAARVKQSVGELGRDFRKKPALVASQCALLK